MAEKKSAFNVKSKKMNGAPICSGRSRRTGLPCKNLAMANGKCRFHGGKSTGPKTAEGRQRIVEANLVHGGYQTIWLEHLTDEEREMYDLIPVDAQKVLEDSLRLITIRETRMLKMQREIDDGTIDDVVQTESSFEYTKTGRQTVILNADSGETKTVNEYAMVEVERKEKKASPADRKLGIDAELTKVQAVKAKYVDAIYKLQTGQIKKSDGSLDKLVDILAQARKQHMPPQ